MSEKLKELLLPFRHEIDPLRLIFLIEDYDAMKVCAAFPYTSRTNKEIPDCFDPVDDYLPSLWAKTKVDLTELSQIAGVAFDKTENYFHMLKQSKMIFPDGTIHSTARKIIAAYIHKKVDCS